MKFDEWFCNQKIGVSNQNVKQLMRMAYNGGLVSAAAIAGAEYRANSGANVAARSGDAAAKNIMDRINAFKDTIEL